MSKELVIFKDNMEVGRGENEVKLTDLRANTNYAEGHFQAAFETQSGLSELVDVPAFKTEAVGVEVEGVELSPKTSKGTAGEAGTRQLSAYVTPEDATDQNMTYTIEPETVGLSVSDGGLVEWTEEVPEGEYVTTIESDSADVSVTHTLTLAAPVEE